MKISYLTTRNIFFWQKFAACFIFQFLFHFRIDICECLKEPRIFRTNIQWNANLALVAMIELDRSQQNESSGGKQFIYSLNFYIDTDNWPCLS